MTNMARLTCALIGCVVCSGGCATTLNDEIGLIGIQDELPALHQHESRIAAEPSLQGLDRRNWSVQTVRVPLRQVEHNISVGRSIDWHTDAPHGSHSYPTVESALDVQAPAGHAAGAAALELVALAASWIVATVDAVTDESGAFGADRSPRPRESFQRLPASEPEYVLRWVVEPEPTTGTVARRR